MFVHSTYIIHGVGFKEGWTRLEMYAFSCLTTIETCDRIHVWLKMK